MMKVRLTEHQIDAVQPGAAEQLLLADLVIVLKPGASPMYAREIAAPEELRG